VSVRTSPARPDLFRSSADDEVAGTWAPSAMPTVPRGDRGPERAGRTPRPGYALTPWGPAPVGRAMPRRRPLLVWVVAVLTLGVAHIVWYHHVHREMAAFDRRRDAPVWGPVGVLVLLGVTLVAPLRSYAATARRIGRAQRSAGLQTTCRPVVGVLLCLALGLHVVYFQAELNKVVDAYDALPGARVALRDTDQGDARESVSGSAAPPMSSPPRHRRPRRASAR